MTALKTAPITTGTTRKLSGNGLRGDLDGEGASILSTTPECGPGLQGLRVGADGPRPPASRVKSQARPHRQLSGIARRS
jgi:hypothetical protein